MYLKTLDRLLSRPFLALRFYDSSYSLAKCLHTANPDIETEGRGPLGTYAMSEITGPWASGRVQPGLTRKRSPLQCQRPPVVSPSCNNNKKRSHRHFFKCLFSSLDHVPATIEVFC